MSSIPGCNSASVAAAREAMNSYLPQRRRKKKRKLSGGGGKWPKAGYHAGLETRSLDSEENRSVDFGHKDDDGSHLDDEGEKRTLLSALIVIIP